MSAHTEQSGEAQPVRADIAAVRKAWLPVLVGFAVLAVYILLLFHQTIFSMIDKWATSQTYAHGFVIVPISAWLIWRRREVLHEIPPQPDVWALPVMAALGIIWLVGEFATVVLVKQYAVVGMLVTSVWLVAGRQLMRAWAFPLFFLFLAVPVGYFLVPPLMQFTADTAVTLVRWSGVPVYREGFTFTLPTGTWSVIEACSGLRYVIASVTLGCLYAYLTYRSLGRRLLFILASSIVPVIANGLRAYLIVMIGHLSSMRLATGIDHIIYGWIFFGLVMLFLFWAGSYWREDMEEPVNPVGGVREYTRVPVVGNGDQPPLLRLLALIGVVAVLLMAGPVYSKHVESKQARISGAALMLPKDLSGWQADAKTLTQWSPHYIHLSSERRRTYMGSHGPVGLYVGLYRDQKEGSELIAWENNIIFNGPTYRGKWASVAEGQAEISLPNGRSLSVPVTRITDDNQYLDVWSWYWVAGEFTADKLEAKLLTLKARLLARSDAAAVIVVYVPVNQSGPTPKRRVSGFIRQALPAIEHNLVAATGD